MAYFLGLDAGGTRTECALARDENLLARATGNSIKIMRVSASEAEKNLDDLLKEISAQSGVSLDSMTSTCVGLAGKSVPRVRDWTFHALRERIAGNIMLAGDQEIALDAAFHGGAGVMVVAGTGSNLIGRTSDGQRIYVGGWGPVLADEGSGNWIGRRATRAVFDALDYDETTLLREKIFAAWGIADTGGLIDLVNQSPGPDFSKLTPLVVECAGLRDPYAMRVLEKAGSALGKYAVLAARRVRDAERNATDYPEIAFTGGILRNIASVREAMCAAIRRELPQARIRMEAVDSVQGALWRARQDADADRQPTS